MPRIDRRLRALLALGFVASLLVTIMLFVTTRWEDPPRYGRAFARKITLVHADGETWRRTHFQGSSAIMWQRHVAPPGDADRMPLLPLWSRSPHRWVDKSWGIEQAHGFPFKVVWRAHTDQLQSRVLWPGVVFNGLAYVLLISAVRAACAWVVRAQEAARRRARERRRRLAELCVNCAYSLHANTSGVCPECGTPCHRSRDPITATTDATVPVSPAS